ncbi:TIGR03943 family putative permease subunit [Roseofilum sp. Guam]|uniref:TIGR03943 family putative permease subunit n=1 Tax=Roseofilum sp. Guam TaxID=2821502 RepID=UPI00298E6811|nr:TIGR03943 family protein [Roseofilum sp. Guam]
MMNQFRLPQRWLPTLDVVTTGLWGFLLIKLWISGELNLLIHPAYHWLIIIAGVCLLGLSGVKGWQLWKHYQKSLVDRPRNAANVREHVSLLPQSLSCYLLLLTAIVGLTVRPQAFTSETALKRGVNDFIPITEITPQSFTNVTKPEERSLVEWVRTLNVYPEPDAYTGQNVQVSGFVIHPPDFPPEYGLVSRFIITCCAADAYPIGLPVKFPESRETYAQDSWVEIKGAMATEVLNDNRKLVIVAQEVQPIPEPKNPYNY